MPPASSAGNSDSGWSVARARPRIDIVSKLDAEDAMNEIQRAVELNSDAFRGQFKGRHALISVIESKRHFWSPWLNLEMIEVASGDERGTQASALGRFSPHPSLWTAFAFSWLTLGVLAFFSLIVGMAQNMMGSSPWGYALVALWLVIAGLLRIAALIGQKLAWQEMHQMTDLIRDSLQGDAESSGQKS